MEIDENLCESCGNLNGLQTLYESVGISNKIAEENQEMLSTSWTEIPRKSIKSALCWSSEPSPSIQTSIEIKFVRNLIDKRFPLIPTCCISSSVDKITNNHKQNSNYAHKDIKQSSHVHSIFIQCLLKLKVVSHLVAVERSEVVKKKARILMKLPSDFNIR
jgi:hypothetical protein